MFNRNADTKQRIFGMSCEEIDKKMTEKRQTIQANKERGGKSMDQEFMQSQKSKDPKAVQVNKNQQPKDSNDPGIASRPRSFMDENFSDANREREEKKIQQRQWLDQQIFERKSRDQKEKHVEKMMHATSLKRDAYVSSQSDRMTTEKQDKLQEIRNYNEAAANKKRADDKKQKEMDIKETNDQQERDLKMDMERQRAADEKDARATQA